MDAVTHCITSDVTQITMTEPLLTENLQLALSQHRDAAAAFDAARDNVSRIKADLEKNSKAAEAAEAEALAARDEAAVLMRDTDASMKQIRDLKGKERAAYTLAEDYRSIIAELQLALDEASLDAGIAQRAEADAYSGVVNTYAVDLLSSASQTLQPFFHAIHVLADAYSCQARQPGGAQWQQLGYDTSMDAALGKAFAVIRAGIGASGARVEGDAVLDSVERPPGRGDFTPVSPVSIQRLRAELAQRKARLRESVVNRLN